MNVSELAKQYLVSEACECCGTFGSEDNPVTFGADPYAEEIYEDYTPVWECENCRYESAMDI